MVLQHGIGDAEIALGVFEVDGIDLVRHGRTADFAIDRALLEIAQRDIAPEVAAEADEDGVEPGHVVEELGDEIMRLDLGGGRARLQAEIADQLAGELRPVDVRIGGVVRALVADRAIDLAEQFHLSQLLALALRGAAQTPPSPCPG